MWSAKKFITLITFLTITIFLSLSFPQIKPKGSGIIVLGPWNFEEINFADEVIDVSGLNSYRPEGTATTLEEALLGYSPEGYLANIGNDFEENFSNLFQLTFTDLLAVNNFGADIVFFDCHFVPEHDPFDIAIRPQGGEFTEFITYDPEDFVDTGVDCESPFTNWGVAIDISRYGFPLETVIDAILFRALPGLEGDEDGDPSMAAVLIVPPNNIFLPIINRTP